MSIAISAKSNSLSENTKERYIEKLINLFDSFSGNNNEIIGEECIEFEINDFNKFVNNCNNSTDSIVFNVGGRKCIINARSRSQYFDTEKYFIVSLKDVTKIKSETGFAQCVLSFRNHENYSCFTAFESFDQKFDKIDIQNDFILDKSDFIDFVEPLIDNNKIIISAYIRVYDNISNYLTKLKDSIEDDNVHEIIAEDYYEWKIEDWNSIGQKEYSPEFIIGNNKWKVEVYPDGCRTEDKDYVSILIRNISEEDYKTINMMYIIVVRNYYDFSSYRSLHPKKSNNVMIKSFNGFYQFIKTSDLFCEKEEYNNRSLVENGKVVIGIYMRMYKYSEDRFISHLKELCNNDNNEFIEDYYEWKIDDWNALGREEYSPIFKIIGHQWKIKIRKNDCEGYLSVFLDNVDIEEENPTIHICCNFVLSLRNYNDYSYNKRHSSFNYYYKGSCSWGWKKFMPMHDLEVMDNSRVPLIENNSVVICALIRIYRYKHEIYLKELKYELDQDNNYNSDQLVEEKYYEYEIQKLNPSPNKIPTREFTVANHKWKLEVYPNGNDEKYKDYLSLYLYNMNDTEDKYYNIPTRYVLFIRNYNDYSCFYAKSMTYVFHKSNESYGYHNFANKNDIYSSNQYNNKSLVENEKVKIGVLLQVYSFAKDQLIKEIKDKIDSNSETNDEIIDESYHEWKIEDWNALEIENLSNDYKVGGQNWRIKLCINKIPDFVSLYLENVDFMKDYSGHSYCEYSIVMRNSKDYSCYEIMTSTNYFSREDNSWGWSKFSEINNLFTEQKDHEHSIIENNQVVIGAYIRVYQYNKDIHMKELVSCSKADKEDNTLLEEKYKEWEIDNWNELNNPEYDKSFEAGGYQWQLQIYPKGNNIGKDHISLYLNNMDVVKRKLLNISARFSLIIRNKDYFDCFYTKSLIFNFKNGGESYGYHTFIKQSDAFEINPYTQRPFIENNQTVVGAYLNVYEYNKDTFMEYLRDIKKPDEVDNLEIKESNIYEMEIDYSTIENEIFSPEFVIGGHTWKLKFRKNDDNNEFVSYFLYNIDSLKVICTHITVNYTLYIRNTNDYSYSKVMTSTNKYNGTDSSWGFKNFIKKSDIFYEDEVSHKSLIENNKFILGVYINVYKYDEELFKKELDTLISNELKPYNVFEDIKYAQYKIDSWNEFKSNMFPEFTVGGHKWTIKLSKIEAEESKDSSVSMYIYNTNLKGSLKNVLAKFVFFMHNYKDYSYHRTGVLTNNFGVNRNFGFRRFILLDTVSKKNENTGQSLVEDDTVIVGVMFKCIKYNKEVFIESLKSKMKNKININYELFGDGYIEWKIMNWSGIKNELVSPVFNKANHKWALKLGIKNNNKSLSIQLYNMDISSDKACHVCCGFSIAIRNPKDYSYNKTLSSINFYNRNYNYFGWMNFIEISELEKKELDINQSLLEDNQFTICIYLNTFKYNKELYLKELKGDANIGNNKNNILEGYYEWEIQNWSELKQEVFSSTFKACNQDWKLSINPNNEGEEEEKEEEENKEKKNNSKFIGATLYNTNDFENDEIISAKFVLILRHPTNYSRFFSNNYVAKFSKSQTEYKIPEFIEKLALYPKIDEPEKSIIDDDKLIMGIYIFINPESK